MPVLFALVLQSLLLREKVLKGVPQDDPLRALPVVLLQSSFYPKTSDIICPLSLVLFVLPMVFMTVTLGDARFPRIQYCVGSLQLDCLSVRSWDLVGTPS